MKIKDLPEDVSLLNLAFYHPETKEVMYWRSQWRKGVWARKDLSSEQVFPIFVNDLDECFEWEIVSNKNFNE